MSIEFMMPSYHLIRCGPLLLLPSIFHSIRVFSNESVLISWPKYWSFGFSIISSNEYSGQNSFKMDWLDLLEVQGLSRVFSNTTVQKHQFFSIHLSLESNSHFHTWLREKNLALTRWTFAGKVTSLVFNMLSKLVIAFLPRNKHLLISWLQSSSAVTLEPKKINFVTFFHCFPIYLWSTVTICHDFSFLKVEF